MGLNFACPRHHDRLPPPGYSSRHVFPFSHNITYSVLAFLIFFSSSWLPISLWYPASLHTISSSSVYPFHSILTTPPPLSTHAHVHAHNIPLLYIHTHIHLLTRTAHHLFALDLFSLIFYIFFIFFHSRLTYKSSPPLASSLRIRSNVYTYTGIYAYFFFCALCCLVGFLDQRHLI